jgi:hypothetical protein
LHLHRVMYGIICCCVVHRQKLFLSTTNAPPLFQGGAFGLVFRFIKISCSHFGFISQSR